jgi:HEAT repeat protein
MRNVLFATVVLLGGLAAPAPAWAYIGSFPTLGKLTADSPQIVVTQVDRVNRDRRAVLFQKVADLKGKGAPDVVKQRLTDGFHPRQARAVLDWAEPGEIAVCFQSGPASLTCIGGFWYQCAAAEDSWWTMTAGRPELSYIYSGSTGKLRDQVTAMLAGREVVITALKDRVFGFAPGQGVQRKWENWDTYEAVGSRRLMRGKDWPVCRIRASLKMPNTVPELYREAGWVLGDGPGGPEDVPALAKALTQADARVRIEAAEDLGRIGRPAAAALPALVPLSEKDPDPLVRLEAAKAVASIDPKNETALPILVEALRDRTPRVRKRAAECLGDLGAGAAPAVAALVKAVSDSDPAVAWAAIDALGQIGPDAEPAVPALREALRQARTRGAAIDAVGQIGRKARPAAADLEEVLRDDDAAARWAAAASLVRIGGPGVSPAVRYLLVTAAREKERNWTDATHILMAPSAREALPALLDAVREPAVRDLATEIALEVSPYLMNDPLADVKGLLKDKDAGVRCLAAWVLHSARAVDIQDVIAVQRETLTAPDPWARRRAAQFLDALGPAARDTAEALSALLQDKDPGVRDADAKALARIQQK